MKRLILRHYKACQKRGVIKGDTFALDFIEKLEKETDELILEYECPLTDKFKQEAIDCLCVITNMLIHYNIDIESELLKNVLTQEKRANGT